LLKHLKTKAAAVFLRRRLKLVEKPISSKKPRRIPATHGGKKVKSVISGDMGLGNDISHDG